MKQSILLPVVLLAACGGGGGGGSIPPFSIDSGIAVADLNADGLDDVVVTRTAVAGPPPHPGSVDVYFQRANHAFAAPIRIAVGSDPWNLAVGDMDGDGRSDIVVANSNSGDVSILIQNSAVPGSFLPARHVLTGGTPYGVAIADINGDSFPDLAVALQNAGGGVAVLLQNPAMPLSFLPPIALSNGTGAISVAVGDLDHDGHQDIAVSGDSIAVFLQDFATGSFGSPVQLAAGLQPSGVVIADANADGLNDLLVSNAGSPADGSGATVSVLLQDPGNPGNFLPAVNYPVADGAQFIAEGPLTGGAVPDIALISTVYQNVVNPTSTVSILRNQGTGIFVAGQVLNGPSQGNFIAVGDINADGLPDIVVNNALEVFLQSAASPGTFNTGVPLP